MKATPRAIGAVLTLLVLARSGLRADEAVDRAVRAVVERGGRVTRDEKAKGKPVIGVELSFTEVTNAGLKELATLQTLDFPQTKVTDAGLKELTGLKTLQALTLSRTPALLVLSHRKNRGLPGYQVEKQPSAQKIVAVPIVRGGGELILEMPFLAS